MLINLVADEQSALSAAWRFQRTGNSVAAFDLVQDSLQRWPKSHALQYLGILALASCGSTRAALDALRASDLHSKDDEDSQALEARLLKDLAFSRLSPGAGPLAEAAAAYERVADRTGGTYSRENAALLWTLAGERGRGAHLSTAVMQQLTSGSVPADEEGAYFYWATIAEAALVLDDHAAFEQARNAANLKCRRNAYARARTRSQMGRLAELKPDCVPLIGQWYQPPVGFVMDGPAEPTWGQFTSLDAQDLPALGYCYGRAPGAHWQELAALGIQLHAIYPDAPVDPAAPAAGIAPERDASGHTETHTWSSLLLDDIDDQQACARTALGLSLSQANEYRAPWVLLAKRMDRWVAYPQADRAAIGAAYARGEALTLQRRTYAFLFADAVSYSTLNAEQTRRYWTHLLPRTAAAVLQRHAHEVVLRKTWGDALHAVFKNAGGAASAALEIQEATANLDEELGAGRRLSFRIALHYGPADEGTDPVEQACSVFGPQLSFAARIEPVAPPGGVFVTEAFAARLSLEGTSKRCAYVGTTRLPKSYGRVRLLRLAQDD